MVYGHISQWKSNSGNDNDSEPGDETDEIHSVENKEDIERCENAPKSNVCPSNHIFNYSG